MYTWPAHNLQFLVTVNTADPLFVVKDIWERGRRVSIRVLYIDHILNRYAPLVNVALERASDQFIVNEEVKFMDAFVFVTSICNQESISMFIGMKHWTEYKNLDYKHILSISALNINLEWDSPAIESHPSISRE